VTLPVTGRALSLLLRYSKASTDFTVRVFDKIVWPRFDILIRLALAQAFFVSRVMRPYGSGIRLITGHPEIIDTSLRSSPTR
jgi:hypothetical protein